MNLSFLIIHHTGIHQVPGIFQDKSIFIKATFQLSWRKENICVFTFILRTNHRQQGIQINSSQVFMQTIAKFICHKYRLQHQQLILYCFQVLTIQLRKFIKANSQIFIVFQCSGISKGIHQISVLHRRSGIRQFGLRQVMQGKKIIQFLHPFLISGDTDIQ
ncbi:hypothetical protein D3C85_1119110 [compost metagenome]